MRRFSPSQAAIIILISLFLLTFYGWRHFHSSHRADRSPQIFPVDVVIQVTGEVGAPGTYAFDRRVSAREAVARAGGLLPHLKPESQWKTLWVENGRTLSIAAGSNGFARLRLGWMPVPSLLVLGVPLDVNRASANELVKVPGISRRLAKRIVARRQQVGRFRRLEDLRGVKGIGPVSLNRLRPYLKAGPLETSHSTGLWPAGSGEEQRGNME